MKLAYKIGFGVLVASNFLFISLAIYGLITRDARIKENRKFLSDTIKLEVEKQIPRSLPRVTGEVYVPNK
tara:strand:+ start:160 stop:369 length:210 start_codon:yes stop_codon:yes gene_type:complete